MDLGEAPPGHLRIRSIHFTIVDGPGKGLAFRTEGDPVRIGSARDNSLVLTDSTVSRHHAELLTTGAGLLLRDLGSTNGTYVAENRVKEIYLKPAGTLRVGSTTLSYAAGIDEQVVLAAQDNAFCDLIGRSVAMRQLFGMLRRVAGTNVSVILQGETGTGKEVCARAIHESSRRAKAPFIVLDCSGIDRELAGSEIFGHERGAFTGAVDRRAGVFEAAHGGTVFIDELGELPLELQAKLLRVLEQREVKRLGSLTPIPFDCRIVAATHRNLETMVREQRFREDLYYRLAQVTINVPPLRERRDDIPLLVTQFLSGVEKEAGSVSVSDAGLEALRNAPLKGNVRQLKNLVLRAITLAEGNVLTAADFFPPHAEEAFESPRTANTPTFTSLQQAERATILATLVQHNYNRRLTAEHLGITLPTLRKRIRQYGIPIPQTPPADSE